MAPIHPTHLLLMLLSQVETWSIMIKDLRQDNSPSEMDEESDSDQQEQESYLPSPAQTTDCYQVSLPRVKIFPFFKPSASGLHPGHDRSQ
ncbi:hypothetical protein SCLCIDRAFT_1221372 [Scleroderma citrinum Foug A]|uniref:Uncharacterized protein n=1 Tax=Scleroderma citrinum Foug A TaxID=1036808 RepID=A0A0C3DFS7_9AGAM|nr:hypothetical protein SCLCIDRAFT_1221372 [Scleroderma citrinum Foug A]